MKISICSAPIRQGHPQDQFAIVCADIRQAATEGADMIILPNDFPGTFASPARRIESGFSRSAQTALAQLAATAPQCLLVGHTSAIGTDAPACWTCREGQVTMHPDGISTYRGYPLHLTVDAASPAPEDGLQICFWQAPFAKSGSHRPQPQDRTLYVSPLGVHDYGKTIAVYDGGIYWKEAPRGVHALQRGIYRITGKDGSFHAQLAATVPSTADVLRFALQEICARWQIGPVIIGLSGGIDSALNLLLYRSILPPAQLLAVNMPSAYNTDTTKQLAQSLAEALAVPYLTVPIQSFAEETRRQLNEIMALHGTGKTVSQFVFENIQARDRSARVLAALAAMYRGVFTCNGNKAELTIGYGTMYGDISGFLCASGDLWKGEVYELADELNRVYYNGQALPSSIFTLPPSAELSPAQNPEDGHGDPLYYPYHDCLFQAWTEGPAPLDLEATIRAYREQRLADTIQTSVDIYRLFPTEDDFIRDATRWWKMYRGLAVAKRLQSPPVISLSPYPPGARCEAQYESETAIATVPLR